MFFGGNPRLQDRGREDYKESKEGGTLMGGGRETGNGTAMWLATATDQVRWTKEPSSQRYLLNLDMKTRIRVLCRKHQFCR